jgi:hypothetical protein
MTKAPVGAFSLRPALSKMDNKSVDITDPVAGHVVCVKSASRRGEYLAPVLGLYSRSRPPSIAPMGNRLPGVGPAFLWVGRGFRD